MIRFVVKNKKTYDLNKLTKIFPQGVLTTYEKDVNLIRPEETPSYIYYIHDGAVKLHTNTYEGGEKITLVISKGEIFPVYYFIKHKPSCLYYTTLVKSKIFKVPMADFAETSQKIHDLNLLVFDEAIELIGMMGRIIINLETSNAFMKLTNNLYLLAEKLAKKVNNSYVFGVQITQEDIANTVGLTRETVNRGLSHLLKKGYISYTNRYLVINNIRKYCKLINSNTSPEL